MTPRLTLLSRSYCHLCEQMLEQLGRLRERHDFLLEVVDVDREPALEEKWGDKVPVLLDAQGEICHYYLDVAAFEARFARMK